MTVLMLGTVMKVLMVRTVMMMVSDGDGEDGDVDDRDDGDDPDDGEDGDADSHPAHASWPQRGSSEGPSGRVHVSGTPHFGAPLTLGLKWSSTERVLVRSSSYCAPSGPCKVHHEAHPRSP